MIERVIEELEGSVVEAPPSLERRSLLAAGLADGYTEFDGPIGGLFVAFHGTGVTAAEPAMDSARFEADFLARTGRPTYRVIAAPARVDRAVRRALVTGKTGSVPADLRDVSDFRAAVLRTVARIPPGEVRPYSWVAREIGRPGAQRAVGAALASNPIPLLIPCHRVIRSDGAAGDYRYGSAVKARLLRHEGVDVDSLTSSRARGKRLLGSDTTRIYCYPTCRSARRVTPSHQQWFGTAAEAVDAGYRPCRICRPEPG